MGTDACLVMDEALLMFDSAARIPIFISLQVNKFEFYLLLK